MTRPLLARSLAVATCLGTALVLTPTAAIAAPSTPWDVNGDGFADLAVGAPLEDVGTVRDAGAFFLLPGSSSGATGAGSRMYHQNTTGVPGAAERDDFVGALSTSGDFDGDGFADVAVSADGEDRSGFAEAGMVHVLYGSASGPTTTGSQTLPSPGTPFSAASYTYAGVGLSAGDFDGDGLDDLAFGMTGRDAVQVYRGTASGLAYDQTFRRARGGDLATWIDPGDGFGYGLSAGDLTGDGAHELVVGMPWDAEDRGSPTGSVVVFPGSASGLTLAGAQRWSKDSPGVAGAPTVREFGDGFGQPLAIGDLDGDGAGDLAVGAPYTDVTASNGVRRTDAGTVNVLYGSADGLTATDNLLLTQKSEGVPGGVENFDGFGVTLAAGNADTGAPADLAVGSAGDQSVTVFYGADASGVNGVAGQLWTQETTGVPDSTVPGELWGFCLRFVNLHGSGHDDLAVGNPIDNDARGAVTVIPGSATGLTPTGSTQLTQATPGVPDNPEVGDFFGSFF